MVDVEIQQVFFFQRGTKKHKNMYVQIGTTASPFELRMKENFS